MAEELYGSVASDPVVPPSEQLTVISRLADKPEGQFGPSVQVFFRILGGQFKDVEGSKFFTKRVTPRTDTYALFRTCDISIPDQIGAMIPLGQLVGKTILATFEPNTSAKGNTYNNVKAFRRYVAPYAPQAGAPAAPAYVPPAAPPAPAYVPPAAPPAPAYVPPAAPPPVAPAAPAGPRPSF